MLKHWKINKTGQWLSLLAVIFLAGCTAPEPVKTVSEPEGKQLDFGKFIDRVVVAEKTPSSVVYEYQDVRVDEVSLLAAMYCQDHGNRNAYLEKINLYKNNRRRASFYCSSR